MSPPPSSPDQETPRLVLVGSVLVDLVMPLSALPPRGGDVLATGATFTVGGGWYVLSGAAGAGLPVAYSGRHGTGPNGDRVRSALDALGAEVLLPAEPSNDTGLCVTLVEPDGERTFVTHPGVEATLESTELDQIVTTARDIVYVSGYDLGYPASGPAIAAWLQRRPPGAPLVIDPGPLVADIPRHLLDAVLRRTTLLTLNRREATLLTGLESIAAAMRVLPRRLADGALLVVRDGASGAHVSGGTLGSAVIHVPAQILDVVDTTGAGDLHTGAMIASLVSRQEPVAATGIANTAAGRLVASVRR